MRKVIMASAIISIAVIVGVAYLLFFYGDVSADIDEDNGTLKVKAPMVDETIHVSDIIQVQYFGDEFDTGKRVSGFGSPVISSGSFENSGGRYTLASYSDVNAYISVKHTGGTLVFNLSSVEETHDFYERMKSVWPGI